MVKSLPSNSWYPGLIPGWRDKIPYALQPKKNQNIKQKRDRNKVSKDCKNGLHSLQALGHKYHLEDRFSVYHTTQFQHIL